MKSLSAFALLVSLLTFGCKTPTSGSELRASEGTPEAAPASFVPSALNDSLWQSTFDGGSLQIALQVRFKGDGGGTIISSSSEETIKADFSAAHLATAAELEQAKSMFGSDTFPDARGNQVRFTEALVVTDGKGELVNILPILHPDEMLIFPVGTVIRQDAHGNSARPELP